MTSHTVCHDSQHTVRCAAVAKQLDLDLDLDLDLLAVPVSLADTGGNRRKP